MRLICPNCGAQYEVPDDVIPDAGRDVQCSNCGNTWYQHHPDNDPELREELIASGLEPETTAGEMPEAETEAEEEAPPDPEPEPDPEPAEPTAQSPQRRSLDPSIAEVLREEAEREARARAAEGGIETLPDLGLGEPEEEADRRARQVRERMARMKGLPDDPGPLPEVAADDTPVSRRDLLPDIDEINSSLRAASDRRPAKATDHELPGEMERPETTVANGKSGFRRGFALALLLTALLWAAYSFAPRISAQVPALEPTMTRYVAIVDQGRALLDEQVRKLLTQVDAMSAEQGDG